MRAFLLTVLAILPLALPAQLPRNWERGLQQAMDTYFNHLSGNRYEALADMMYPGLYELTPRETMVEMMEEMDAGGLDHRVEEAKVLRTAKPVVNGQEQFIWVEYTALVKWILAPELAAEADLFEELKASFEAEHGSDAVSWKPSERTLQADAVRWLIAVYHTDTKAWTFLELDPRAIELAALVVPEPVWAVLMQTKPE